MYNYRNFILYLYRMYKIESDICEKESYPMSEVVRCKQCNAVIGAVVAATSALALKLRCRRCKCYNIVRVYKG